MFQNNHKFRRYNAHIVSYKDLLNQNKQRQRDYHIYWFKDIKQRVEAEKCRTELRQKLEMDIKHRITDKNNITKTNHLIIPAIILSMNTGGFN